MVWKEIEGHNGYLISNTGLIKRKEKTIIMSDGKKRRYKEKVYTFKKYGYSKKHTVTVAGGKVLIYENIAPLYFEKFSIGGFIKENKEELGRCLDKSKVVLLDKEIEIINELKERFRIHSDDIKTLCEWEVEFYSDQLGITKKELEGVIDFKKNGN